jgi:hypothetical protein
LGESAQPSERNPDPDSQHSTSLRPSKLACGKPTEARQPRGRMASASDREHLLRHGYVIIQALLPPRWLDAMRDLTEDLIERHKELTEVQGEHRPGCFAGTMSPYVEPLASAIDFTTAAWVELWASPESPVQRVSSGLLNVDDAALASMEGIFDNTPAEHLPRKTFCFMGHVFDDRWFMCDAVLCQDPPHRSSHKLAGQRLVEAPSAPGTWHRDFYPSRCAPLESWAADAAESGGPTYIQWNIA